MAKQLVFGEDARKKLKVGIDVVANAVATTTKATGTATGTATKPAAKPSSSTNKKGVSIPKTNDTTSNLPYVLIAVAFVGLVALVASKRKVNG